MFKSTHTLGSSESIFVVAAIMFACAASAPADARQAAPALPPGTWEATGPMSSLRSAHTATRLRDGRVLVTGGVTSNSNQELASAEIFDPASRTWSLASPMSTVRVYHTATLLPNGQVLVSGGRTSSHQLASAELYDPAAGAWFLAGDMSTSRSAHTATLLADGRVLVVGGYADTGYESASAEIYDPAQRAWTTTGALDLGRTSHTATRLVDGRVLVTGGVYSFWDGDYYTTGTSTTEIYDPAVGSWSFAGAMSVGRYYHTATLLADGRVLVAGAYDQDYWGQTTTAAEIYDPALGTWALAGDMRTIRYGNTATLLANGRVLVTGGAAGGIPLASTELYDPALGSWSGTSYMSTQRGWHTATLLAGDKVLVAGGATSVANAATYDPSGTPPPDASAPQVTCGLADAAWHRVDVWIACTASDPQSGLANEGDVSVSLGTSVPVGTETANAATNSHQVCNMQGGCTTAGPISGNRVDKKPPMITIASPAAGATYWLNADVTASYGCADAGAGIWECRAQTDNYASITNGHFIDTSTPGSKWLAVSSSDFAGNEWSRWAYYTVSSSTGGAPASTDVGLTLSAPVNVSQGGTVTYTMTAVNAQTGTATGVLVVNGLPAGTVFASASVSQGYVTAPTVGTTGAVSAHLGTLGPGATATVTVIVKVTAAAGTTLTDMASISATTPDSNSKNNSATKKTMVKR